MSDRELPVSAGAPPAGESPALAPAESAAAPTPEISFARLISTSIGVRILFDIAIQIFNPFLAMFAQGIGTSITTLGLMLSLRNAMGLLSPFFGAYADRHGYRLVMRIGILLAAAGIFIFAISTNAWMAAPGMILAGLGVAAFVPNLLAYLSARLPYAQRGRGIGMLEYSWALTGIAMLFIGFIIAAIGWRIPLLILSAALVVASFVIAALPAAHQTHHAEPSTPASTDIPARIRGFFDLGRTARSAYGDILVGALTLTATMQFMIIYGAWLYDEYGLNAGQLGVVAFVFGLFDLSASVSVSLFTDRIGKRRSVIIGSALAIFFYLLLPALNRGVVLLVIGLGLARMASEFAIVSNFPLLSEQVPTQRGKVMTLSTAAAFSASSIAPLFAPTIYTTVGPNVVALISAALSALALLLLLTIVRERPAA